MRKLRELCPQFRFEDGIQRHGVGQVHQPDTGKELPESNQACSGMEDAKARWCLCQIDQRKADKDNSPNLNGRFII